MNTSENGFNKVNESVHSEIFDSATTRSVGRGLCLNAWPLVERAPHMHWIVNKDKPGEFVSQLHNNYLTVISCS